MLRFPNEVLVTSMNREFLAGVAILSEEDVRGPAVTVVLGPCRRE
jgi:hypothetical protein